MARPSTCPDCGKAHWGLCGEPKNVDTGDVLSGLRKKLGTPKPQEVPRPSREEDCSGEEKKALPSGGRGKRSSSKRSWKSRNPERWREYMRAYMRVYRARKSARNPAAASRRTGGIRG